MRPQWEGGWWRKGVAGVQVRAAVTLPKEHPPPPLIPPLLFTSLFLIPTFSARRPLLLLPPSLFFPSPFFSASCPHSHCSGLTQHMITPLCTSRHLKEKMAPTTPNAMHKWDSTLLVCPFCFPLHEFFLFLA